MRHRAPIRWLQRDAIVDSLDCTQPRSAPMLFAIVIASIGHVAHRTLWRQLAWLRQRGIAVQIDHPRTTGQGYLRGTGVEYPSDSEERAFDTSPRQPRKKRNYKRDGRHPRTDLTGSRFGTLTVLGYGTPTRNGYFRWRCRCDCGNERQCQPAHLRTAKSCRKCHNRSQVRHGLTKSPTYKSYHGMLYRCFRASCKSYYNYGGRGVTVCQRWVDSFENFVADMGERPLGTSLDRIDSNGNYEPGNCRWADRLTQARNTRRVKLGPHSRIQIWWMKSVLGCRSADIASQFGVTPHYATRVAMESGGLC